MRLNQLAKKVGKPYTRIEKYIRKDLKIEGIEGPNARVTDEILEKVISKFGVAEADTSTDQAPQVQAVEAKPKDIAPEERGIEEVKIEAATPAENIVPNMDGLGERDEKLEVETTEESSIVEEPDVAKEDLNQEVVLDAEPTKEVTTTIETEETTLHLDGEGVIVAPKVELQGFTVKGKIDLPQTKKEVDEAAAKATQTEELPAEEEVTAEPLTAEEEAAIAAEKEAKAQEVEKAKIARAKKIDEEASKAAAYKAKKAKEEQQKLKAQIEKDKAEKRAQGKEHYLAKVQQPAKPNKKKVKAKKVQEEELKDEAFAPKEKYQQTENLTTWQKIVRWFNT